MIENIPAYINILFGLTVLATIAWFYAATRSRTLLIIAIAWTIIQSVLGLKGLYLETETLPPRPVLFGILPTLLAIILTFILPKGRKFIDTINLKTLTYSHSVRILVEIVLALLFHQGLVSVFMTFEGTNYDILSGLTAPLVAALAFRSAKTNRNLLLWWNVICLALLLNVVITAAFAIPSPIQKIAFDQPNIAILYFPFNLLPSVVVPMVLFAHLAAMWRLTKNKGS